MSFKQKSKKLRTRIGLWLKSCFCRTCPKCGHPNYMILYGGHGGVATPIKCTACGHRRKRE